MALGNTLTLGIGLLLLLFVVTVVGIDEVVEFADLGLEMVEFFFRFVEVSI